MFNDSSCRVHCTHAVGYSVREAHSSWSRKTPHDEIILADLKVNGASSSVLGRCFVEVENSQRGTSYPLIIADNSICKELKLLEPETNGTAIMSNGNPTDHLEKTAWSDPAKNPCIFWMNLDGCSKGNNSCLFEFPDYQLVRFKFLLVFSVEHDFCALVKTLLDILLELNSGRKGLEEESLELSEIHLLNRAVKRRCWNMVNFLIHFSIVDSAGTSENFIFLLNMAGPGGLTPLHLAASASSSDATVDILTSDPQEIGLRSWNSLLDANGLSPYAYALMRNHHSYNVLVSQKLADKKNDQVSVAIEDDIKQCQFEVDTEGKAKLHLNRGKQSCFRCEAAACSGYSKRIQGSKGMLQRTYIHSILVVATVCVCVCMLIRGHLYVGYVSPFSWENLEYGTI